MTSISTSAARELAEALSDQFSGVVGRQLQGTSSRLADLSRQVGEQKGLILHVERSQREQRRAPPDLAGIVAKAITALVKSQAAGIGVQSRPEVAEEIAEKIYRSEPLVQRALRDLPSVIAVVKAAVSPASTATAGWAAELVSTASAGLIPSIAPQSLYSRLAPRGLRLDFTGIGTLRLPAKNTGGGSLGGDFVAENAPIPIRQMSLSPVDLSAKKLAVISAYSAELAERSAPSIEAVVRQAIADDTGLVLDTRMLDANAATAARPAGLLFGVTPITATTGGGVAALAGDLGALAAAVPAAADLVYIMNPADRVRALAQSPGMLGVPILESSVVTAKTVIALDAADLVTAEGDEPRFMLSENAAVHMSDVPTALAIAGSPNTISAPARSFFQEDLIGIRLILHCTWGMRRAGRVATVASVTW
jgi:hypothetical protein